MREKIFLTMARRRFLGLWYFSQSLALANSSSFLERYFRLTSVSASPGVPPSSARAMAASLLLQLLGMGRRKKTMALIEGNDRLSERIERVS